MKPNGMTDKYRPYTLIGLRTQIEQLQDLERALLKSQRKKRRGRPPTKETPQAVNVSKMRKPRTPEQKARMSAAQQARWKTKKQIERGMLPKKKSVPLPDRGL